MIKNRVTKEALHEIIKLARKDCSEITGYRFGQAVFNRLPDNLANEVRGTVYDTFHTEDNDDDVISILYMYYVGYII